MFLLRDLVSPRTWLAAIHNLVSLFIGVAAFGVFLAGYLTGFCSLLLGLAGWPVLGATQRAAEWFGDLERKRFQAVMGITIPGWRPATGAPAANGTAERYRWGVFPRPRILKDRRTWTDAAYPLLRFPIGLATSLLTLAAWSVGLVSLTLPLYNADLPAGGSVINGMRLGTTPTAPAIIATTISGLALLLAAPRITRGLASLDAKVTKALLAPPANLQQRVTELEQSRERVVDAAEAERRRIERDLHDGAQQRLVALAMELGRAKQHYETDPVKAKELLDQAHDQAKQALTELRGLVRGVHPPVLTDRGLDAALSGLIALCPVPVTMRFDVPVRPKANIEAIAYFSVAEALTNIAKHARASHVTLSVEGRGFPGTLTVMVTDDGIGGADPQGQGLTGLADRAAGVDGSLTVESPRGGPTIIAVELPCA